MNYIAIIPARGGSKGLPDKNLKDLLGKPLVAWSVIQALASDKISRVIVSTDSQAIAKVAKEFGAEVPFLRPAELSTDDASTESALLHTLDFLKEENCIPDAVVLLQPTSPVRSENTIEQAIEEFESNNADSLVSVCASHAFFWKSKKVPEAQYDFNLRPRRQDIAAEDLNYRENGSIYITKTDTLVSSKNRLGGKITLYEMPEIESHEIDSLTDFIITEQLMSHIQNNKRVNKIEKSQIDAIVFDFDGVLTDNRVLVLSDGTEGVVCNRSDGLGFDLLREAGIPVFILSTETNPVVSARANKLGVPVVQNAKEKGESFLKLCEDNGLDAKKVIFIGNDINDLPVFSLCGYPIVVNDAVDEVKKVAWKILESSGGDLVVREIIDTVIDIELK